MPALLNRFVAIGLFCALASPASAQLRNEKSLSAAMALTIAQTSLETCTKQGYHVSVHVLGRNGEVLVAVRGDGASPHTMRTVSARLTQPVPSAYRRVNSPSGSKIILPAVRYTSPASSRRRERCRSRPATR